MNKIQKKHLPPDVQQLVDNIMIGIVTLASRVNSNMDSNSIGGRYYLRGNGWPVGKPKSKLHDLLKGLPP